MTPPHTATPKHKMFKVTRPDAGGSWITPKWEEIADAHAWIKQRLEELSIRESRIANGPAKDPDTLSHFHPCGICRDPIECSCDDPEIHDENLRCQKCFEK